jgi:hypothetical protein
LFLLFRQSDYWLQVLGSPPGRRGEVTKTKSGHSGVEVVWSEKQ